MVSKSGTTSTPRAARRPAVSEPDLLQQEGDLEQVAHALGLRDDAARARIGPKRCCSSRAVAKTCDLRAHQRSVVEVGRDAAAAASRSRAARAAARSPSVEVAVARRRRRRGTGARRRPVRARRCAGGGRAARGGSRRRAPRSAASRRRPLGDASRAGVASDAIEHVEIVRRTRRRSRTAPPGAPTAGRRTGWPSAVRGRREPRVDADQRAPVGLVGALRRVVRRAPRRAPRGRNRRRLARRIG